MFSYLKVVERSYCRRPLETSHCLYGTYGGFRHLFSWSIKLVNVGSKPDLHIRWTESQPLFLQEKWELGWQSSVNSTCSVSSFHHTWSITLALNWPSFLHHFATTLPRITFHHFFSLQIALTFIVPQRPLFASPKPLLAHHPKRSPQHDKDLMLADTCYCVLLFVIWRRQELPNILVNSWSLHENLSQEWFVDLGKKNDRKVVNWESHFWLDQNMKHYKHIRKWP